MPRSWVRQRKEVMKSPIKYLALVVIGSVLLLTFFESRRRNTIARQKVLFNQLQVEPLKPGTVVTLAEYLSYLESKFLMKVTVCGVDLKRQVTIVEVDDLCLEHEIVVHLGACGVRFEVKADGIEILPRIKNGIIPVF